MSKSLASVCGALMMASAPVVPAMAQDGPGSASATMTTEIVGQATCVTISIRRPDGSGASQTTCTTSSNGTR